MIGLLLITIIAVTVIVGYQSWKNNIPKRSDIVKIGAILPLTGGAAFVGIPIKDAILLKINKFNEESETKVEIIFEDSKADIKEAVSAFEKLKSQGIKVVFGPVTSGEVLATAPIAEKNQIILLSPSASSQSITNAGDYIFRNELSDQLGSTIQAQLAINRLNWKKIAVIYTDNDYGFGVKNSFENEFKKLGGEITNSVSFKGGTTDFKTQILKIKSFKQDAIFVVAQNEYPIIIRQFIENKVHDKIYATPIFEDPSFIKSIGKENSDGVIYTYYGSFDLDTKDNASKIFISDYMKKYNIMPTYYAALGYDSASILIEALVNVNFYIKSLKNSLYEIKNFKGVTGDITFDNNGDVLKPVILKTVKNGMFVIY